MTLAGPPARPTARRLAALAFIYTIAVLAVALAPARALGHDEAVYAIGGRGLVDDVAADEFPLHRSIGMRPLAVPGVLAGGELGLRLPFALIALGYLATAGIIARRRFGDGAAALAVAVVATTSAWQWRAAEALSDIPSALALLGLIGLLAGDRRGVGRAVAAGACAAAACYLRYAAVPIVAAIVAIAFAGDPARRRFVALAAAATALFLAPLFTWSALAHDSPIAFLTAGERMGHRAYPGAGLVFYLRSWPLLLAGPVTGVVAAIGLVAGLAAWRAGLASATPAQRARRLLATAAVVQIVLLGWRVHGETRYIFFALTALVIVGAAWLAEHPRRWRAAVIAVAVTALPSAIWTHLRLAHLAASRVPFTEAMAAIRADAPDADCLVYSTEVPMVTWYTRCRAIQVDGWGLDPRTATGAARIYLLEARGLPRSIGGVEAATRDALGWQPLHCSPRWCLWRAHPTRSPRTPLIPLSPAPL